ncbi:DNA polymerase III%2C alpha subunit [Streptococcus pneumoniae]|nr:DNA polymerase III%2C alpha subunit [Streptococcus pneumoniae]
MSNSFEILMNQLGMPAEMRQAPALAQANIERVVVHKISKVWEFHFVFSNILPIEIFLELKKGLSEEFSKTGNKAVFEIKARSQEFSNQLLQSYYREAFSEGPCASQGFKSLYQNLQVRAEGNQLFIEGSEAIDKEHFKKNHLPNLAKQLEKFGFPTFNCQVEKNDVLTQEQEEAFHAENEQIVQAANEEALRAMEQLEQMAPPPAEEKPVFDFQAKKAAAKPKLDKAEITPMIEVTTEENRLVFEGVVFDVEQKVTRTGRVLINFKMTDYTSSFSMQKWVKNEEEAQKFDLIKKNSWLRVRGNVEMNNFTRDLTMNVQDLQEVVHYERKDLMPEGERRVEFHAHTNMSTMDALPEVEEIVATAAKWGHKAVAITDHGNVQSFPHGYKAAKKAGIQLIYGMEANIVEDRVPIVYNEVEMDLSEATYVVFDVETTGLSAIYNDLIQVAASKMYKGNVIAEFDEFINPGHPLSAFTTELTGITDDHVKNAKPLEQVLQEFQEFCKDTVLVAHNATFDVGFMNANYERHDLPKISQPVIDTLEFARNLYPEYKRHGLGPLTKRFGVALEHHHMANYDAEATGRLLFIFIKEVAEKHGVTDLARLNIDLISPDSYKKARIKHATIYVKNQVGLKNIFKLVSLSNTKYFEGVPRIPRTVLDAHREGLILGSACSEGEVFDVVVSQGVDAAVEVAKYYDFIEVMPPAIYAPLIAKEQVKDMEELQTIIKSLIEVGDRLGKPVLATGNVHYIEPEEEIYREIIVRSLGQGAMINRTIGHGEHAQPAPLPKAHFRTTNEMLDDLPFWERNWLVNWLLKTPMPWQKYLNPLKSLRVICIRLSSTRLKKQLLS